MRYLLVLLFAFSSTSIFAQEEQPQRTQSNGIGINLMYDGSNGLLGEAVYERFVGRRFLLRAQAGGNLTSSYSFGFSAQYALVDRSRFKVLAGLGYHRLDSSRSLTVSDGREITAYTGVPLDIRVRVSSNMWINAGVDLEISNYGNGVQDDYLLSRLRLGAIYGF